MKTGQPTATPEKAKGRELGRARPFEIATGLGFFSKRTRFYERRACRSSGWEVSLP